MNDKDTWKIGKAKIYKSIWLENPIVVGSIEGISEIYIFITNLQAENKKLRELIDDLVNCGMDNDIATRIEALKEVGKK